jgi:hypothetical protein
MTERTARIRDELLLRYPESQLTRVATTQVQSPLSRSLPSDYPEFLDLVGWGEVGRMQYMFYSGPILPDEIFDPESVSALVDVFLIGDNFAGDPVGYAFRDNQWHLVEVDHTKPEKLLGSWPDIFAFIEDRFLSSER